MEIFGFYIQQKTFVSPTCRLLCKQIDVYHQVYENTQQFKLQNKFVAETPPIQNIYSFYHIIQVSAMVLQSHSYIISPKSFRENAKKSGNMDSRGLQNFPLIWYQSHHRSCFHQTLPPKIWWKISTMSTYLTTKLSYLLSYELLSWLIHGSKLHLS